jgi:hypothetical protein
MLEVKEDAANSIETRIGQKRGFLLALILVCFTWKFMFFAIAFAIAIHNTKTVPLLYYITTIQSHRPSVPVGGLA